MCTAVCATASANARVRTRAHSDTHTHARATAQRRVAVLTQSATSTKVIPHLAGCCISFLLGRRHCARRKGSLATNGIECRHARGQSGDYASRFDDRRGSRDRDQAIGSPKPKPERKSELESELEPRLVCAARRFGAFALAIALALAVAVAGPVRC